MTENTLQWVQASKLLVVAVCAALYGFGGVFNKWLRRFVAPAVFVAALCLYALLMGKFSYWLLLCYPLWVIGLSKGYGSDSLSDKFVKRFICGALIAVASLPLAFCTGGWILFSMHSVICIGASLTLGVTNPTPSARNEETLLGALYFIMPLFFI